jgi:sugar phosphate isomerase/epimerase
MTRREMLGLMAATAPLWCAATSLFGAEGATRKRLGVGTYSYGLHWRAAREGNPKARFKDPLEFLEYCHQLGAGGVQMAIGSRDAGYTARLRARAADLEMYIEGDASLPRDQSDVPRFDAELRTAKEAGAEVVRTAMLNGRRYETFDSAEAFHQFAEKSWQSLTLAEPVLRKHHVKLAIENHKDRRTAELLDLLKRISSEWVGVCVDIGNNLALLEDPMETVGALATFAFSTHLKDMAVQEYEDGFLLSEVPLGEGFLDLKGIVERLQKANPKIQFNLEMITRDPLRIPCLTEKYWTTMPNLSARELASALAMVRRHAAKKSLLHTTGLDGDQQLALEDAHVKASFVYARKRLGL